MRVTDCEFAPVAGPAPLLGFARLVLDGCLLLDDLKLIAGSEGRRAFVSFPSRRMDDACGRCHWRNHLQARYCNGCGAALDPSRGPVDAETGRRLLYRDSVHPVNNRTRLAIEAAVLAAYRAALEAPGPQPEPGGASPPATIRERLRRLKFEAGGVAS